MSRSGARKQLSDARAHREAGRWPEARDAFRRILQKRPRDVEALVGCAEAERHLQQPGAAEPLLLKALRADPTNPDALLELGKTQINRKQFGQAIRVLNQAAQAAPNRPEPWLELGRLYVAVFEPERAVSALQRGLARSPDDPDLLRNLGDAFQSLGRWGEAIRTYETIVDQLKQPPALLYNLATCYRATGRFDEALDHYRAALESNPELDEARAGLAETFELTGRHDEAESVVESAVGENGPAVFATIVSRIARRRKQPDGAIRFITNVLEHRELANSHRAQLLFQLGDLLERESCHDEAFERYAAANALFPNRFDAEQYRSFVSEIISAFDASLVQRHASAGLSSDRPVLIVGMPRSGTSLVEQILASHPKIFGAGELEILSRLVQSSPNRLRSKKAYPKCVEHLEDAHVRSLAHDYLSHLDEIVSSSPIDPDATETIERITDKMPHNFMHLGLFAMMFPNARIVHCRRNAADTCFSCFATSLSPVHSYANNLEDTAVAYREYERLMSHFSSLLPQSSLLEVTYEELVDDLEPHVRRLIEFVGLEWDDGCLQFHESDRVTLTASTEQVRQPIYRSSIGRAERFRPHTDPLFEALG